MQTTFLIDAWCLEAPCGYCRLVGIMKAQLRCMQAGPKLRGTDPVRKGPMHSDGTRPRALAHGAALPVLLFSCEDWCARACSGVWGLPAKRCTRASKNAEFGIFAAKHRHDFEQDHSAKLRSDAQLVVMIWAGRAWAKSKIPSVPLVGLTTRARVLCARDRTHLPLHSAHDARRSRA